MTVFPVQRTVWRRRQIGEHICYLYSEGNKQDAVIANDREVVLREEAAFKPGTIQQTEVGHVRSR